MVSSKSSSTVAATPAAKVVLGRLGPDLAGPRRRRVQPAHRDALGDGGHHRGDVGRSGGWAAGPGGRLRRGPERPASGSRGGAGGVAGRDRRGGRAVGHQRGDLLAGERAAQVRHGPAGGEAWSARPRRPGGARTPACRARRWCRPRRPRPRRRRRPTARRAGGPCPARSAAGRSSRCRRWRAPCSRRRRGSGWPAPTPTPKARACLSSVRIGPLAGGAPLGGTKPTTSSKYTSARSWSVPGWRRIHVTSLRQHEGDDELALLVGEVGQRHDGAGRSTARPQEGVDVERRRPGPTPRRPGEARRPLSRSASLVRSAGGKNSSSSNTPSLRSGGGCTWPTRAARSRSWPCVPGVPDEVGQQDVLAAGQRVGLDADEAEQAGDVALRPRRPPSRRRSPPAGAGGCRRR